MALLATCRCVYLETHRTPLILNTHYLRVYLCHHELRSQDRQHCTIIATSLRGIGEVDFYKRMSEWQLSPIDKVHVNAVPGLHCSARGYVDFVDVSSVLHPLGSALRSIHTDLWHTTYARAWFREQLLFGCLEVLIVQVYARRFVAPGREAWLDEVVFFLGNQMFTLPGGRVIDFDREFAEKHKRNYGHEWRRGVY